MKKQELPQSRFLVLPLFSLCLFLIALSVAQAAGGVIDARAAGGAIAVSVSARVENTIKAITLYLAQFVEFTAALVIGIASLQSLWAYFRALTRARAAATTKEEIRLSLGRSLALALEFELGADILKTAVAPTWNDIGLLAAIAVLRTALNYFLEQELRNAERRSPAAAAATDAAVPPPLP